MLNHQKRITPPHNRTVAARAREKNSNSSSDKSLFLLFSVKTHHYQVDRQTDTHRNEVAEVAYSWKAFFGGNKHSWLIISTAAQHNEHTYMYNTRPRY
jgi:hypothetical protein